MPTFTPVKPYGASESPGSVPAKCKQMYTQKNPRMLVLLWVTAVSFTASSFFLTWVHLDLELKLDRLPSGRRFLSVTTARTKTSFALAQLTVSYWNLQLQKIQEQKETSLPQEGNQQLFYETHWDQMSNILDPHHNQENSPLVWQTTMMNISYNFAPFRQELGPIHKVPLNAERDFNPFRLTHESTSGSFSFPKIIEWHSICHVAQAFSKYPDVTRPHVLLLELDENWGAFSSPIPGRTVSREAWPSADLDRLWAQEGCSRADIWDYLNHHHTRAVITTQFQTIRHPKVHSLPLGLRCQENAKTMWKILSGAIYNNAATFPITTNVRGGPPAN